MKNGLVNILRVGTAIGLAAGSMLYSGCATTAPPNPYTYEVLSKTYNVRRPIYNSELPPPPRREFTPGDVFGLIVGSLF